MLALHNINRVSVRALRFPRWTKKFLEFSKWVRHWTSRRKLPA